MPKQAEEWSALDVKRASHPGGNRPVCHAVGGVPGLNLQVAPSGAKSWLLRAKVGDKRREIGLGGFPGVTLAQARERAREARDSIWRGVDPVEERKAVRAALVAAQARNLTFAEAVERYLEGKLSEFRNEKHKRQWRSTLDNYAAPIIGKMAVADIAVQDVQKVLVPIWESKTETASRLRGRIESVLAWATVQGFRQGDNPARWKGNLDAILPKPGKVAKVDNLPALALGDVARWFADLRKREGTAARALEIIALTACRSGEVRGMTWGELDLERGVWTIPATRMKASREHRAPLTPEAVKVIEAMPREHEFVFAAQRGGQLSDMSVSAVMRRAQEAEVKAGRAGWLDPVSKRPAVPHGLRSTFRQWAAENGHDRDMAEMALAHRVGSETERAYQRADMLERRRGLMAAWAKFLQESS